VLEDSWNAQDIGYPAELKARAERELEKLSRPRFNYTITMLDLRTTTGFQHETFKRSDTIDIIDEDFGTNTQARIIRHRYNVFQKWLCEIEVGDPLEKTGVNMLANSIVAADYVNSSVKPNTTFQNMLKAKIDTAATEINGASGDYSLINGVSTWFERVNGVLTGNVLRITPVGIIISSDGGQAWDLAINGAGINANMINTGELNTGLVRVISPGSKVIIDANGLEVVDGKIYGTHIKSGAKDNVTDFIEMTADGKLNVYGGGIKGLVLSTDEDFGGRIDFLNSAGAVAATLRGTYDDAGNDLFLRLYGSNTFRILGNISTSQSITGANVTATGKVESGGYMVCGTNFFCNGSEADFAGSVYIDGDLEAYGPDKNCVVATQDYGFRALSAREGPEIRLIDEGLGTVTSGFCRIEIDSIFMECIEPHTDDSPWLIHLTPYGNKTLYVDEVGDGYFVVGGSADGQFAWSLSAVKINCVGTYLREVVR
ncbi:MAG TPA: phage tail spike protein, partial [Syntrophomonas sp.]|nr:phage tail spike protein [Syntrophomonas sp.]